MTQRTFHHVAGRLSLRAPQAESLHRLRRALEAAPALLSQQRDVAAILHVLKSEFPTLSDFEREFPSLCFALATGVGKTRLMGAFIAYLHLTHGINNFFVLAPNLTIYQKLITDFTRNTPKYVFKGIAEFAQAPPLIINGDNYEHSGAIPASSPGFVQDVRINVFNISKINSEVRGGKEPRIKRMREVLGDSYFNHLAALDDLVLLMDESHRYRASAGVRAINELRPLLGLELTATPFTESSKGPVPFKNVVMDYPLARAMSDGFVKEPAVVTQRNFDKEAHSPEALEQIKLEDGIRLHENTKVELLTYARENDAQIVKPFVLVIARDTTHAAQLLALIESDRFYEGRYRGKVIQVDSSKTGADEEKMIERLLAVESVDEPTEVVIHVNMLKEGWDVTNLYTIVPLRAASARTLIEQSIGRGLRLPYGKRTGVPAVDQLSIVAHDRFQEIIDEANRGDSPIRLQQIFLDPPSDDARKISVQVEPTALTTIGLATADPVIAAAYRRWQTPYPMISMPPMLTSNTDIKLASAVMEVLEKEILPSAAAPPTQAMQLPAVQAEVARRVTEIMQPQTELFPGGVADFVAKVLPVLAQGMIDIPRIVVVPSGEVTTGFDSFALDVRALNLQPGKREIVIQNLRTNEQTTLASASGFREDRLEDYIVHALVDFDDVDYFAHAELLYDLARQMVRHLLSYLSEDEARQVLDRDRQLIAREIHTQMMRHFWQRAARYDVRMSHGPAQLKPCPFTANAGHPLRHVRETLMDALRIRQVLFTGFERCLYPLQRFESDTERRFAVILEREAIKWFKPAKGQFQIYYRHGAQESEYQPDFVAEFNHFNAMFEIKSRDEFHAAPVRDKALAASAWCQHACAYSQAHGGKRWRYALIPHDEVVESKAIDGFLQFEVRSDLGAERA